MNIFYVRNFPSVTISVWNSSKSNSTIDSDDLVWFSIDLVQEYQF